MADKSQFEQQSNDVNDGESDGSPNEGCTPQLCCHDIESDSKSKANNDNHIESDVIMQENEQIKNKNDAEINIAIGVKPEVKNITDCEISNESHQGEILSIECQLQDTAIEHPTDNIGCDKRDRLIPTTSVESSDEGKDIIKDTIMVNQNEKYEDRRKEDEPKKPDIPLPEPQMPSGSETAEDNKAQNLVKDSPGSLNIDPSQSMYYLKRFKWRGDPVQIVTQNENGPCPLLAIANALILLKRILIPPVQKYITANQLMEYIGDYMLSSGPQNVDEVVILNYQQNMQDAIAIMYKLQTGIDVNVRFTGPQDFELTQECLVFDILNIPLYHGWLIDPQNSQIANAVGNLSYNQLVEKIIKSKDESSNEQMAHEGLLAESFLDETASQLTYHGLCELNSEIKEEEICVFFRNNHFNTLYKYKGELFLLVTDQGYLNQSKIIWETLSNVDGESQFVTENFHTVGPLTTPQASSTHNPQTQSEMTQEDRDYLIALSLQEESHAVANPTVSPQPNVQHNISPEHQELKDLEYAKHLQEQENRRAWEEQQLMQQQMARQQQQQQQQQQRIHNQRSHNQQLPRQQMPSENRSDKCIIL